MKRFIKKLAIFVCILTPILMIEIYLSHLDEWRDYFTRITNSSDYVNSFFNGSDEIKPFISEVQEQNDTETLVLGDSICHQMFENLSEINEDITFAGSNAAITMAGQYILAKEYLNNHTNAKEIYLMVHPTSLKRTFDTSYGYQYIIMPFSETDTLKALDKDTIDICKEVYGNLFLEPNIVFMINKSGMNRKIYLNMLQKYGESYEEKVPYEIADQYIRKIYEMCEERGVNLYLLASPVSDGLYTTCEQLEKEYQESWMKEHYPNFFKEITYYPAEQAEDGFHFSGEYEKQEYFNELIKKVFEGTPLMEKVKFY